LSGSAVDVSTGGEDLTLWSRIPNTAGIENVAKVKALVIPLDELEPSWLGAPGDYRGVALEEIRIFTRIGDSALVFPLARWRGASARSSFRFVADVERTNGAHGLIYDRSLSSLLRELQSRTFAYRVMVTIPFIGLPGGIAFLFRQGQTRALRLEYAAGSAVGVALFTPAKHELGYLPILVIAGAAVSVSVIYRFSTKDAADDAFARRTDSRPKYSLVAITGVLLLVAAMYRFYNLGFLSLTIDEIYTGLTAKQLLSTGWFTMPDGTVYTRGVPDTALAALLMRLGVDPELSTRA